MAWEILWALGFVAVFIALSIIVYHLVRTVLSTIAIVGALFVLSVVIGGFLMAADLRELSSKSRQSESLVLVVENRSALAAFTGSLSTGSLSSSGSMPVSAAKLAYYDEKYSAGLYRDILGPYYKLVTVRMAALEDMPAEGFASLGSGNVKEDVLGLLREGDSAPLRAIAAGEGFNDTASMRGFIAAEAFESLASDSVFLMEEYKNGNVEVYPESLFFKAVRLLPAGIMSRLAAMVAR